MSDFQARTEIREGCDVVAETVAAAEGFDPAATAGETARVYLLGCGSSRWVATVVAYAARERGLSATAVPASEFLFSSYPTDEETLVVGFSQSGETTETVRAFERATAAGATTLAVTNTRGSTLASVADDAVVTPAGEERAVLATKSVDAALTVGYLLAARLAGDDDPGLLAAGRRCHAALDVDLGPAVEVFADADRAYALGVGEAYGLAGEAATKLAEGPLLHTTPLPALEMQHGYVANVAGDAALVLATNPAARAVYPDLLDSLRDAGADTVVVYPEGADYADAATATADAAVAAPAGETVLPALTLVQRLAVDLAARRGFDPDDPPELSKHVTWEPL